jgi:hypothetical protein
MVWYDLTDQNNRGLLIYYLNLMNEYFKVFVFCFIKFNCQILY